MISVFRVRFIWVIPLLSLLASCGPEFKGGYYKVFPSKENEKKMMEIYDEHLKSWPIPLDQLDVETSFGLTHVIAAGDKDSKPLVLLNGLLMPASTWHLNIKALARNHRVYALDTIGDCGKTRTVRLPKDPKDYADWLSEVYVALGMGKASIVGASRGGYIAHWFSHFYPNKLDKLAIFSFSPMGKELNMWTTLRMLYHFLAKDRASVEDFFRFLNGGEAQDKLIEKNLTDLLYYSFHNCKPAMIVPSFLSDLEVRNLKVPTLIVLGEKDVIYEAKVAREYLQRTNPSFIRFEELKGASHLIITNHEHSRKLEEVIGEFLNR